MLTAKDKFTITTIVQEKIKNSTLSLRDLSAVTGIFKTHINDIENMKKTASFDTLFVLADYFKINYCIESSSR